MNEMMNSGVELMLIGMGIVFAFLALLIVMVNIMTAVIQRFFPEDPVLDISSVSASTSHTDTGIIAAISAAVHQYRSKYK
jgi:oxaloacetate decarboxylase gamma subunit